MNFQAIPGEWYDLYFILTLPVRRYLVPIPSTKGGGGGGGGEQTTL